jgi:hypothetical protein
MSKTKTALLSKADDEQVEMFTTQKNDVSNLLSIAIERGAGIEQLSTLMDLQLRMTREQSRRSFIRAMLEFQNKVEPVIKSSSVRYQSSKGTTNFTFAKLSDIIKSITPTLYECGLAIRWKSVTTENMILVTFVVSHVDGWEEETTMSGEPDTSGGKNNIQAKGSTMTYLQRYTLNLALGICTEDDNDGAGGAPVQKPTLTQDKLQIIRDRIRSGSAKLEQVAEHFTLTEEQTKFLQS